MKLTELGNKAFSESYFIDIGIIESFYKKVSEDHYAAIHFVMDSIFNLFMEEKDIKKIIFDIKAQVNSGRDLAILVLPGLIKSKKDFPDQRAIIRSTLELGFEDNSYAHRTLWDAFSFPEEFEGRRREYWSNKYRNAK